MQGSPKQTQEKNFPQPFPLVCSADKEVDKSVHCMLWGEAEHSAFLLGLQRFNAVKLQARQGS